MTNGKLYSPQDIDRPVNFPEKNVEDSRSPFRKDYARLIHSPCFRRLEGKTQLFPGTETDFFRNRLTHSLEVAQIATGITRNLNKFNSNLNTKGFSIDVDLVEFASVAHDLGHPPFGHVGEEALDLLMRENGGYEGNAQTFRLLTKIEKRFFRNGETEFSYDKNTDNRLGINPTFRSLASILKYDSIIPMRRGQNDRTLKAYYSYDEKLIKEIKQKVTGYKNYTENFKTLECSIMDVADDIAYSIYDLEDCLKAGFLNLLDILSADERILEEVLKRVNRNMEKAGFKKKYSLDDLKKIIFNIFPENFFPQLDLSKISKQTMSSTDLIKIIASMAYKTLKEIGNDGYLRTNLTSQYIGQFINGVELNTDNEIPALWTVSLKKSIREKVEVLKNFVYVSVTESSRVQVPAYRGSEIINLIFNSLSADHGYKLLPSDYRKMYLSIPKDDKYRERIVCDFIAGMTDRYAIEFYGRLKSENPETIFKPI